MTGKTRREWWLVFGRVYEIISQAGWYFLQEHSSVGEHRLCWNGSACAWPAPCGECWYDDDWHFLSEMLLAHINLSGLPRNLWKVPQTFGRAGRDEKLQAVGVQMYWPGQKGLLISIFISIAMHATHATIITTERTTRPQASLLEMKFQFYRQDHSSRRSEGDFHWTRLPQSCHQRCIHPQQCPQ